MSTQQSKDLVRDWVDTVLNGRRFDEIPRFTDNEAFGQAVQGAVGALPDLRVEIVGLVAEDDRIVLWGRGTATHEGTFRGIPPTGEVATMDIPGALPRGRRQDRRCNGDLERDAAAGGRRRSSVTAMRAHDVDAAAAHVSDDAARRP